MKTLLLLSVLAILTGITTGCTSMTSLRSFNGAHYRFKFGHPRSTPLSDHNLAECQPGNAIVPPVVIVDELQWQSLTATSREALLYHELGHCILHKPHSEHGIMKPTLVSDSEFEANREAYIAELMGVAK